MRIRHKVGNTTATEIHQARSLSFVNGIAETPDDAALAAALGAKGYHVLNDAPAPEAPKPKRRKDVELTEDVALTEQPEPEIY